MDIIMGTKRGYDPILSREEEHAIVKYMCEMVDKDFPIPLTELQLNYARDDYFSQA